MRSVGSYVGAILAGGGLLVLAPLLIPLSWPVVLLLAKLGLLGDHGNAVIWFPLTLAFLLVGLALGHERHATGSWGWACLLALGAILGAPVCAWLFTDDTQAGALMPPGLVQAEYQMLLRMMLGVGLVGVASLFAGTWVGGLMARRRGKRGC